MTETDLATPSLNAASGSLALRDQFARVRTEEIGRAHV